MQFVNADCERIAIENPIGYMNTHYRKADQIIQPWMFGDAFVKSTCLWLKGLHPLKPLFTKKPEMEYKTWTDKKSGKVKRQNLWYYEALRNSKTKEERSRIRSKTFKGIADAMAEQWGKEQKFISEQTTLFN